MFNSDPALAEIDKMLVIGHFFYAGGLIDKANTFWRSSSSARRSVVKSEGYATLQTRVLSGRWVMNIGHFLFLDAYIKLYKLGELGDTKAICLYTDLYQQGTRISNSCLLDLYAEHITVHSGKMIHEHLRPVLHWLREDIECIWLDDSRSLSTYEFVFFANELWEKAKFGPLIKITDDIGDVGRRFLASHGITEKDWFVCLHVRAPGYNGDISTVRDCDIETYGALIKTILDWGGRVIRLGHEKMPPAPNIPGLVDYATLNNKDSRIDIYLAACCRFFVGCCSGLEVVPVLFGVPVVHVNWAPIGNRPLERSTYYSPKKYVTKSAGQPVSIEDIVQLGKQISEDVAELEKLDISVLDHSQDEIVESVSFFYEHVIQGKPMSKFDIAVQERWDSHMDRLGLVGSGKVIPSIGRAYLERTWQFD
jgi:putative glycosyltransferase (TIGR04372 family)